MQSYDINVLIENHEKYWKQNNPAKDEKKLTTPSILCILYYYPFGRVVESVDTMDLKSIASNTGVRVQVPPRPYFSLTQGRAVW